MRTAVAVLISLAFTTSAAAALYGYAASGGRWSAEERETLRSLGLKRIGDVVVKEDRPEIRGMVNTVRHLVTVEEVE